MGFYDHLLVGLLVRLTIHMIHDSIVLVEAQNTNFSYFSGFDSSDNFWTVGDAQYYSNVFTINSQAVATGNSSCGKLYYKDQVRMKDAASGAVASFSTSFTFFISGLDYAYDADGWLHGDGLAFTFGRNNTLGDIGGSLCLLKEANNGQPSNQLFAVEFDTFQNPEYSDPSNNHIGVDINSMNSTWSYNLCGGTLINCTYLCNGGSFTAWIDYDNTTEKLDVYFANGSLSDNISKPPKPLIEATQSLTDLLDDYMYVGFSASTGVASEDHQIQAWQFSSSGMPEKIGNTSFASANIRRRVEIIAEVCGAGAATLLLAVLGFFIARYRRRALYTKQEKFSLEEQNDVPHMYTYKELSKATKNFSRSELLGRGGFGTVYKGTLPSGTLVAVKRMRHESKHGEEGFQAEARCWQIRHRNLVPLRGWCQDEENLMLVYDYLCNGNLEEWLFQFSKLKTEGPLGLSEVEALPLQLRHSILSGVAAAMSYLHEECKQCILHRDIKSSNVLLDAEFNACLGDFGLARLIDHQKMEKTTMMAGTFGYMAPEMPQTGKATKESDVYSFGVLMLEVMCGMRPLDMSAMERGDGTLVNRVWRAHEAGELLSVADSRLGAFPPWNANSQSRIETREASSLLISMDVHDLDPSVIYTSNAAMEEKRTVANLLHLGLLCCNPNPEDRPPMRLVSQLLQASESMEMSLPPLPRCKPQARYSSQESSEMEMRLNVPEAGQGSSQSTPPYAGVLSQDPANSIATNSLSILSGR